METPEQKLEKKKIINLYALFGAGLLLSFIPSSVAALLSLLFITGVLFAAYTLRKKTEHGSLSENHTTFIIRTIWIGSFLGLITITAAGFYMYYEIGRGGLDINALMPCADQLMATGASAGIETCLNAFIKANMNLFVKIGLFSIGPVLVYFAVRYIRGLSRALKGYRVSGERGWF